MTGKSFNEHGVGKTHGGKNPRKLSQQFNIANSKQQIKISSCQHCFARLAIWSRGNYLLIDIFLSFHNKYCPIIQPYFILCCPDLVFVRLIADGVLPWLWELRHELWVPGLQSSHWWYSGRPSLFLEWRNVTAPQNTPHNNNRTIRTCTSE